jgi:hypothetical protein
MDHNPENHEEVYSSVNSTYKSVVDSIYTQDLVYHVVQSVQSIQSVQDDPCTLEEPEHEVSEHEVSEHEHCEVVYYVNSKKTKKPIILPYDIIKHIATFLASKSKQILPEFRPFFPKFKWSNLARNPGAVDIIKKELLHNNSFSLKYHLLLNPKIIDFIDELDIPKGSLYWSLLSKNPNAIPLLETELLKPDSSVNWNSLSSNPGAVHIIKKELSKISWCELSENPAAIDIIEKEIGLPKPRIDWSKLSGNPAAIHIIEEELLKHSPRINWTSLSKNPAAINIITSEIKNPQSKVNWKTLSENHAAINIIKTELYNNDSRVDYNHLSLNPAIFGELIDEDDLNKKISEYMLIFNNK